MDNPTSQIMLTAGVPSSIRLEPCLVDEVVTNKATQPSGESRDGPEHGVLRTTPRDTPRDTTTSNYQTGEATAPFSGEYHRMLQKLLEIFSENVLAKILRVA